MIVRLLHAACVTVCCPGPESKCCLRLRRSVVIVMSRVSCCRWVQIQTESTAAAAAQPGIFGPPDPDQGDYARLIGHCDPRHPTRDPPRILNSSPRPQMALAGLPRE